MPAASRSLFWLALFVGPAGALLFHGLVQTGLIRVAFPPSWATIAFMLLLSPLIEEFAFREVVQKNIHAIFKRLGFTETYLITPQNLLTSIIFAMCHMLTQATVAAALTLIPSLFLGYLSEKSKCVWTCVWAHSWFNACFLAAFSIY